MPPVSYNKWRFNIFIAIIIISLFLIGLLHTIYLHYRG